MGSPTRMGNTHTATDIFVVTIFCKIIYLPFRLVNIQVSFLVDQRYTCRVIAAVFQSSQPFYQYGISILRTDISYNSTHTICILIIISGCKGKKKSAIPCRLADFFY